MNVHVGREELRQIIRERDETIARLNKLLAFFFYEQHKTSCPCGIWQEDVSNPAFAHKKDCPYAEARALLNPYQASGEREGRG